MEFPAFSASLTTALTNQPLFLLIRYDHCDSNSETYKFCLIFFLASAIIVAVFLSQRKNSSDCKKNTDRNKVKPNCRVNFNPNNEEKPVNISIYCEPSIPLPTAVCSIGINRINEAPSNIPPTTINNNKATS